MRHSFPFVDFLYTNIGRGHPYYLDGIIDHLERTGQEHVIRSRTSVFELSRGVSLLAWKAVRRLYRLGSSDGLTGRLYARLRSSANYNRPSPTLDVLGRSLRRKLNRTDGLLVVAHPILVGALRGTDRLVYQHGELVTPAESLVCSARHVLVPTSVVADAFLRAGYRPDQIEVTGLCIEPALVSQAAGTYELRQGRYAAAGRLTAALFSSGAEPRTHVAILAAAAESLVQAGHRVIAVAREGGRLEAALAGAGHRLGVEIGRPAGATLQVTADAGLNVATFSTRAEENRLTARLFPEFDFFLAPPHERCNWAMGLGFPLFAVTPCYGTFAPLNLDLVKDAGVAGQIIDIRAAAEFGAQIAELVRSGELARMAERGFGRYGIDGFAAAALFFVNYSDQGSLY